MKSEAQGFHEGMAGPRKKILLGIILAVVTVLAWQVPVMADPMAYLGNKDAGTITILNLESGEVLGIYGTGVFPEGMALAPNGEKVYVASFGAGTVDAFDALNHVLLDRKVLGGALMDVAVTPDGTKLYVSDFQSDRIRVLDTATFAEVADIGGVGPDPFSLAVQADGSRLLVCNYRGDSVSVIDTASNAVVATIPVGRVPVAVAITPDDALAFVVNQGSANITVIDLATLKAVGTPIKVAFTPSAIAFTPDGTQAYVVHQGGGGLSRIALNSGTFSTTFTATGTALYDIAIDPDGKRAIVTGFYSKVVYVYDIDPHSPTFRSVLKAIPVAEKPYSLVVIPPPAPEEDSDLDNDGIAYAQDNCPDVFNPAQLDADTDTRGDVCDNCPDSVNPDQLDRDGDGVGDRCDNCPDVNNASQLDADGDGIGDACEVDSDGDGWDTPQDCNDSRASVYPGAREICDRLDNDCNGLTDEDDSDGDGILICQDKCPNENSSMFDADSNGCIDSLVGSIMLVNSLQVQGALDPQMATVIRTKINNATAQHEKGNAVSASNIMAAAAHFVSAKSGKEFSAATGDLLVHYLNNVAIKLAE
jgi:YVTN family beta-propeller protein